MTSSGNIQRRRDSWVPFTVRPKFIGPCIVLALLWLATCAAKAPAQVGHVVDVEGGWYLDGSPRQPLAKGQALPAGGVIRIQSPSRWDEIKKKLGAAVMRLFQRDPGRYSVHMVRSGDGNLSEAVLQTQSGGVDLAPVFKGMKEGTYYVQLRMISGINQPDSNGLGEPITVKWGPAAPTPVLVPNIKPGLYELILLKRHVLLEGRSSYKPTLVTAWFLVSAPTQYRQAAPAFREVARLAPAWSKEIGESAARGYLRAYLEHLSTQPATAVR